MARVVDVDLRAGCAVHDRNTEIGCALAPIHRKDECGWVLMG